MKLPAHDHRLLIDLATASSRVNRVDDARAQEAAREVEQLVAARSAAVSRRASDLLDRDDRLRDLGKIMEDAAKLRRRINDARGVLASSRDAAARREAQHDMKAATKRLDDVEKNIASMKKTLAPAAAGSGASEDIVTVAELDDRLAAAREQLQAAQRSVEEQKARHVEDMEAIAAKLPDDIVTEFFRQENATGVGAVVLTGRSCRGCTMVLSPVEIATITNTPADEVARCPQCGTFIVRQ